MAETETHPGNVAKKVSACEALCNDLASIASDQRMDGYRHAGECMIDAAAVAGEAISTAGDAVSAWSDAVSNAESGAVAGGAAGGAGGGLAGAVGGTAAGGGANLGIGLIGSALEVTGGTIGTGASALETGACAYDSWDEVTDAALWDQAAQHCKSMCAEFAYHMSNEDIVNEALAELAAKLEELAEQVKDNTQSIEDLEDALEQAMEENEALRSLLEQVQDRVSALEDENRDIWTAILNSHEKAQHNYEEIHNQD